VYYQYILLDENSDRRKNKRAIKKAGTRPAIHMEKISPLGGLSPVYHGR
jgi:hypothetical protein